jgi:hypothetical protein
MIFSSLLADAGDSVSLKALGTFLVAVLGALGIFYARISGVQKGRKERSVQIESPVPTLSIQQSFTPPTWDQHLALEKRISTAERHIEELRNDQGKQFRDILEAGVERETRILDKLDSVARSFHSRVDDILKLPASRTRQ